MKYVGIDGGIFLCELDPSTHVIAFFKCVDTYVVQTQKLMD